METKILKGKEIKRSLLALDGMTFAEAVIMLADQGVDVSASALKSHLASIGASYVTFDHTFITVTASLAVYEATFGPEIEKHERRTFTNTSPDVSDVTLAKRRRTDVDQTFPSTVTRHNGCTIGFRD